MASMAEIIAMLQTVQLKIENMQGGLSMIGTESSEAKGILTQLFEATGNQAAEESVRILMDSESKMEEMIGLLAGVYEKVNNMIVGIPRLGG